MITRFCGKTTFLISSTNTIRVTSFSNAVNARIRNRKRTKTLMYYLRGDIGTFSLDPRTFTPLENTFRRSVNINRKGTDLGFEDINTTFFISA
jgi:hypothetical protein